MSTKPIPTTENMDKIIDVMPLTSPWRLVATLLVQTGARMGEVAHLKWQDIDMKAGTIKLVGKGRQRLVPMTENIKEILDSAPDKANPYVTGLKPEVVARRFGLELQKACVAAGVPLLRPRDLRRVAFDLMLEDGVEVETACTRLGHSPQVAITHYTA